MNVILDTNILFKDPFFKNTDMQKLISLTKKDIVNLYIPEVVWNEFKSQRIQEYNKTFSEYEKKLDTLKNKTILSTERKILNDSIQKFNESKDLLFKSLDNRLDNFTKTTNLQIIKNDINDLNKMWDMYFTGELPFKNIKSREDIPDCFIYLAILNINDPHVICNDNTLKSALDNKNINTYTTIDDFLTKCSTYIQNAINVRNQTELNEIQFFLCNNTNNLETIMKSLLEHELENAQIYDNSIPDDNHEGTIEGIPSIDNIKIDVSSYENNGDDFFSFNFSCSFTNYVEYYIFKADFWTFDEKEIEGVSIQDWNDHYFLAEEEMDICCNGTISIQIKRTDEMFNKEEYIIEPEDISFDNIELSLNK